MSGTKPKPSKRDVNDESLYIDLYTSGLWNLELQAIDQRPANDEARIGTKLPSSGPPGSLQIGHFRSRSYFSRKQLHLQFRPRHSYAPTMLPFTILTIFTASALGAQLRLIRSASRNVRVQKSAPLIEVFPWQYVAERTGANPRDWLPAPTDFSEEAFSCTTVSLMSLSFRHDLTSFLDSWT